jgi:hypothetical protein
MLRSSRAPLLTFLEPRPGAVWALLLADQEKDVLR